VWFDSHCHLHICEEDDAVERVLERASQRGVKEMVSVGIDRASNARSVELALAHDGVYASVGLHPNDSADWSDEIAAELDDLVRKPRVVGVGESGLDFYWDKAPRDAQEPVFRAHIALAKDHDKALIIHTRESMDEALGVLEAAGSPPRFVFHCWSGSEAQLARALEMGAYVSFAGNVSFKNAEPLRAAARLVPPERLLVETDSPFLTPVPFRGKRNEPAHVALVGEAVAGARGETPEAIAALTSRNARALFALQ
jgi:TatD DNase family protein